MTPCIREFDFSPGNDLYIMNPIYKVPNNQDYVLLLAELGVGSIFRVGSMKD
jgi:hypothetical protein